MRNLITYKSIYRVLRRMDLEFYEKKKNQVKRTNEFLIGLYTNDPDIASVTYERNELHCLNSNEGIRYYNLRIYTRKYSIIKINIDDRFNDEFGNLCSHIEPHYYANISEEDMNIVYEDTIEELENSGYKIPEKEYQKRVLKLEEKVRRLEMQLEGDRAYLEHLKKFNL